MLFDYHLYLSFVWLEEINQVIFYIWSCKTLKTNIWDEHLLSNKFLVFSVLLGFIMLLVGIYMPFFNIILKTEALHPGALFLVILIGLIDVLGVESVKWLFLRKRKFAIVNP